MNKNIASLKNYNELSMIGGCSTQVLDNYISYLHTLVNVPDICWLNQQFFLVLSMFLLFQAHQLCCLQSDKSSEFSQLLKLTLW